MRKVGSLLLLSVVAVSLFALVEFNKPARAAIGPGVGAHEITAVYYKAYIYDDHDGFPDLLNVGPGEWYFRLNADGVWYTSAEYIRNGPGYVDFTNISESWDISGDTNFQVQARELDIGGWDYWSTKTVDVTFPGASVNTWHEDTSTVGDVKHYYKYKIKNFAPTANPIADQFEAVGVSVSFSGSGSDPEGDSLSYEWDFGDGATSIQRNPTHTYAVVGTYDVSFRVKDYLGEYSSYQYATVTVTKVIIDQTFVSNDRADISSVQTVGFHAKWAHDNSDIVGGSIYVNETEYVTNGTGWISLNPVYDTVGKRTWNITGVNCNAITVYEKAVANPEMSWDRVQVTLSITDNRINVGDTANIIKTATYESDGTPFTGTITLNDTLTKSTVGTYHYTTQSISGDTHGITEFESNTVAVTFVDTTSPVADAGNDQTVTEDNSVSFDASDSTDNMAIVSYEWSFGDGTTGTGETTTHTYTEPGTYTVTLTVKDAADNSDTDSITVTVEAVPTIFPWWILGVVGVAIVAGIIVTAFLLRRSRATKGP